MNDLGIEEKENHYLIYYKGANGSYGGHAVIYFVWATDATQAILRFLLNQDPVQEEGGGVLKERGISYPHPLAYIETWYKFYGEWQIRELPDWTLQQPVSEVFWLLVPTPQKCSFTLNSNKMPVFAASHCAL